jgi:hypothetical protein
MTDRPEKPKPAASTADAAKRALELKRASAGTNPAVAAGKRADERAAAARSASKSKPWMRKH